MARFRVLVTGGAGFIASNFLHYLLADRPSWEVVNLDLLTYAGNLENLQAMEGHKQYRFVRGSIADKGLVDRLFQEEGFDLVVNFAAESHVDRSILDAAPFIETNIAGTQVLLEAARRHATPRFVQISTDEVYGSIARGSFTEESPLQPNSPYAASKAAADLLCRAYFRTYGLPVIVTRSSNNYGPYQFPEKLIPLMIKSARQGKPLPVYGRGENVRDWLFVRDNCRAIVAVCEGGRIGEVYNIGGEEERQNIEVVELICEFVARELKKDAADLRSLITYVQDRPGHDFRYGLDCGKIRRELGWQPETGFSEGLKKTVHWYLTHDEWLERLISGAYLNYYARIYEQGWR